MKFTKTKANSLFTLILVFNTMSVQAEATRDDEMRILIVGTRGQSRFSAADLLSGRKDGGQEDREIVKTPVITEEGHRMMLVTGPNLCEENTARQTLTTAVFLSSPGPHAVLMVLNLEDQQSQQCDIVKRAQELLGEEVLQYCIVLLHLNHQEDLTGASRKIINACEGRFHVIGDSEPKPAQTVALVGEINKLVLLNDHRFYSVLTREMDADDHEEKDDNSGGTARWIALVLLNAAFVFTKVRHFHFVEILFVLISFTITLRNIFNPETAVPLNLILSSTFAVATAYHDFANSRHGHQIIMFLVMIFTFPSIVFIAASHDEFLRILIVGTRGRSNFSAADLLSGEKDGGQEDGEIVKAPVITDEGRRMMLVTGPNLCEEDTVRQTFTTALFLSSPGPHVILMVLNLEDQQSQQCDIVKRAQELLGAKVLQYCIVLLHQNTKEHLTGASRWIAGDIINACGGRFHVIKDSEPKPAQIAALVAEIDKLVLLNDHSFYSVLTEDPKTEETLQDVHEENPLLSIIYYTLGGAVGTVASHDGEMRILIVGIRGQSRFNTADLMSGRKDSGQEDREIVKTPRITDEGRRMMLVTGPNLCEEDTARQTFTTALFLLSPGPHAVLMVLNLEDQQSQQCDIVKQAQELLGAGVLQYSIVLLLQNHQEHLTGASREIINACGGRFLLIRDSEPKPAQTAALIAEIDRIVSLNGDRFYSVLNESQHRCSHLEIYLQINIKQDC
ncbi:hypothetical protein QQF64_023458 [Cirrhinus molitorella]|uniref:AIG1-type G domain-containing protein n=1 Tax=Cirrhinus molitorella TaxID=172907 RepID=A0ABR3L8V2_9TELE